MSSFCKCEPARERRGAVRAVNRQENSYLHLSQNRTRVNSIQFSISSGPGRQSLAVSVSGLSCTTKIFLVAKIVVWIFFLCLGYLANSVNFLFGKGLFVHLKMSAVH